MQMNNGLLHTQDVPLDQVIMRLTCKIIIFYLNHHLSTFYFENVAFFHAKLELNTCPRVDNQTSGNTLQDSTQPHSGKIGISYPPKGIGASFEGGMPFHTNQFGLRRRHWNLETSSAVVEFLPPYLHPTNYYKSRPPVSFPSICPIITSKKGFFCRWSRILEFTPS